MDQAQLFTELRIILLRDIKENKTKRKYNYQRFTIQKDMNGEGVVRPPRARMRLRFEKIPISETFFKVLL